MQIADPRDEQQHNDPGDGRHDPVVPAAFSPFHPDLPFPPRVSPCNRIRPVSCSSYPRISALFTAKPRRRDRNLGAVDALDRVFQTQRACDATVMRLAALEILQRGRTAQSLGRETTVLRPRRRHLAGGKAVDQRGQFFDGQVLVEILADLGHGRVGAGAKAFDLFPAETAIGRKRMSRRRDLVLADADQVLGAADHAGRGAADLDMGNRSNRIKLEHEVECRDLKGTDIGHAQKVGAIFDGRAGQPALLFLGAPQHRDDRRLLAARRVFGHLGTGPFKIGGRELERVRLIGGQTAQHQRSTSPKTMSSVAMTAGISASIWPRVIQSMDCRCAKPGARSLARHGLLVPSETM